MVLGTLMGVLGLGFTAVPAGANINPNTSYEFDCTTALQANTAAPFIATANLNAAPDPSYPTGASFGASGALSFTLQGGIISGLAQNGVLPAAGLGFDVGGVTVASTDGTATGSYLYTHNFPVTAVPTSTVTGVTWASGSATLFSGNFTAADIGSGVAGGTGLPTGASIVAVNSGNAVISANTTAAQSTAVDVTLYQPLTFTDAAVSTGNVYTTNGTDGGAANIGLTTAPGAFTIVASLSLPFGGAAGVGAANCLATGYDASNNPGPAQTGAPNGLPVLPPGVVSPLVAASGGFLAQPGTTQQITPATAAYVSLSDPPPVATDATYNLAVGGTKTVILPATDTDATGVTGCSLVGSPSDARLAVSVSNTPTPCEATLTDSGSGPATVTFQFNATDGVSTGNTATATVNIGTAPVDEPLVQNVNPGQLVLSCSNPDTNGGTPALTCPDFNFPDITLNGLQQSTSGNGSTLYVSDNRGDPTVGWSLSAYMVATPIGAGSNTNASCSGVVAFCNADVGSHATDASGNGQIAAGNLSIASISCSPHTGNSNPAATAGSGGDFASTQTICTAVATQGGGTFDVGKTYTLVIPSSVYAGHYWGTVEYLVQ